MRVLSKRIVLLGLFLAGLAELALLSPASPRPEAVTDAVASGPLAQSTHSAVYESPTPTLSLGESTSTPTPTATSVPATPTPTASSAGTGGNCTTSLQTLINNAPSGSTLAVPACNYYESIQINKPLTLDGQGVAALFASDVWTGWTLSGGVYLSSLSVPTFSTSGQGPCASATPHCNWPEQVYFDGTPLVQVAAGTTPAAGQFSLDQSRHVVLSQNPATHTVQVATRQSWIDTESDNVTIQNFTFWHGANAAQGAMIGNQSRNNWTLQNSKLYSAHGTMISLGGAANTGTQTRVLNNTIAGSGYLGIGGNSNTNTLVQGNTIYNNNLSGFDSLNWSGGGVKFTSLTNVTMDSNTLYNNRGPGLWCDIHCNGVTYSNNRIHNNQLAPIMLEIGENASIFGNVIYDSQGWGATNVSTSGHVNIYNNFIARAPDLHTSLEGGSLLDIWCSCLVRADAYVLVGASSTDAGTSITVHDNQCVSPTTGVCTSWQDIANDHYGPTLYGNADTNNVILTGTAATDAETAHGVPLQ